MEKRRGLAEEEKTKIDLGRVAVYIVGIISVAGVLGAIYLVLTTPHQGGQFSELYFNNHSSLPHEMEFGEEYNISFTIVSHEICNYTYHIKYADEELLTEEVSIPREENRTIDYIFIPKKVFMEAKKLQIIVECGNKTYDIYFWGVVS
ncbi:MAG: hypothetical protein A7316_01215 [Candidatus Altiarchaeales archaeon WOR_SM1_86-2]|nr:MAG: hypothetical protein A7316_01215 [Candidatus Altiarchaeales archaeon WOR_SM1_86-2]